MIKSSWINNRGEFEAVASLWDEALISGGNYNPFLLSGFILTWWKYFYDEVKFEILVIYDSGRIIGGIPLCVKIGGWREGFARVMRYVGGSAASYTEPFFTLKSGDFFDILKEGLLQRDVCDVLYLSDIRQDNVIMNGSISSREDNSFYCYYASDHMDWAIDLSMGKEKYFASLSKKMLKDLRAKRKHAFNKYGPIMIERVSGAENIDKYFSLYHEFSLQAFKGRSRKSSFEDERYANFFGEFLKIMEKDNRLDAHVLFAGDKVLAISFGYRFGKGFNWVLTGFNYEFKYLRPGYLLLEELINALLKERGETYYNCYGYERFFKEQWCNHQQQLFKVFLIRKSFAGIRYNLMRKAEQALRSTPLAVKFIRKIRGS